MKVAEKKHCLNVLGERVLLGLVKPKTMKKLRNVKRSFRIRLSQIIAVISKRMYVLKFALYAGNSG